MTNSFSRITPQGSRQPHPPRLRKFQPRAKNDPDWKREKWVKMHEALLPRFSNEKIKFPIWNLLGEESFLWCYGNKRLLRGRCFLMRVWVDKGLPGGLLAGVQGVKQEGRGEQGTEQPTCSNSVIMVCAASPGAATRDHVSSSCIVQSHGSWGSWCSWPPRGSMPLRQWSSPLATHENQLQNFFF